MAGKRSYGDRCGIARALDIIGERWALLVVRDLLLGPKRFTDLRSGLPHVSPDVLSQRLRELEQAGILHRTRLPPPAASQVYELTPRGWELEPVILGLGRWGSQAAFPDDEGGPVFSADSAMLALKTLFDGSLARDLAARYEVRLGEHHFRLRVEGGELSLSRGVAEDPDAILITDASTLAAVLWHGRDLSDAIQAGELAVEGRPVLIRKLLRLFPLPKRALAE